MESKVTKFILMDEDNLVIAGMSLATAADAASKKDQLPF